MQKAAKGRRSRRRHGLLSEVMNADLQNLLLAYASMIKRTKPVEAKTIRDKREASAKIARKAQQ